MDLPGPRGLEDLVLVLVVCVIICLLPSCLPYQILNCLRRRNLSLRL